MKQKIEINDKDLFSIKKYGASQKTLYLVYTRKYPLCGYILGVLTHTTAWDRLWGGDYTLKGLSIYIALLHLA